MMNTVHGKADRRGAVSKAQEWVLARIQDRAWYPANSLPSLDALSRQAGVSRHTMWLAIGGLSRQGVVQTGRGRSTTIAGTGAAPIGRVGTWQEIASHITGAIRRGELLPGAALPPAAKFQIRWRVNFRTVRKALASLTNQEILAKIGSRYLVSATPGSKGMARVLFINEGFQSGNPALVTMTQVSERRAQKMGIALVRFEQSFSASCRTAELHRLLDCKTLPGVVIDFWGLQSREREAHFNSLMSALYASRKRVAILDESNTLKLVEPFRSSARVRTFAIAGVSAGEAIGRHLADTGHRTIAYLTTTFDLSWSRERYAGLARAFAAKGLGAGRVVLIQTPALPDIVPLICAAAHLSPSEIAAVSRRVVSVQDVRRLQKQSHEIAQSLVTDKAEAAEFRAHLVDILAVCRGCGDRISRAGYLHVLDDLGSRLYRQFLDPMFHRAIEDRAITAWVCATDGIAIQALDFLDAEAIQVPGRIAVAGFDNSYLSAHRNVTSYDFDQEGLVHRALSFVADRPESRSMGEPIVECPGALIERGTTRGQPGGR
jgi:DNA-binding transcriptional regulator YhcF (GntR family)